MVRRFFAALATLLLLAGTAGADMAWKKDTPAQEILKAYTERANALLDEAGETEINSLFEIYEQFAVMGITAEKDAEAPEGVEITVNMYYNTLNTLQLRVDDADRFPAIAAALIGALYGESMTPEEAARIPQERAARVKAEPDNSFEEELDTLNGTIPRVYYAYYPNQYQDGTSWLQMTIVFPMAGSWNGEGMILGEEEPDKEDEDPDYDSYTVDDDYTHFEVFVTATPEPDSAAAEYDGHQNGH